MMDTEREFKLEFEKLKKETHERFNDLFDRFKNTKNWEINFSYEWSIPCSSFIDEEYNGWYDKMIEDDALKQKAEVKEE